MQLPGPCHSADGRVIEPHLAPATIFSARREPSAGVAQPRRHSIESVPQRTSLGELARLFLKLGVVAFGGPAAHIALMEDEVVRRRGWLSRAEFLDYVGATNLIPGPNSTELAIHIGRARAGWRGLVVAGACFILPAALITSGIAYGYVHFGTLPAAVGLLYGVKPVVIAVILQALWRLGRTAIRGWTLALVGVLSFIAAAAGVHELVVLLVAAALVMLRVWQSGEARPSSRDALRLVVPAVTGPSVTPMSSSPTISVYAGGGSGAVAVASVAATVPSLGPLFLVFLKIGSVLFGSGYVLIAFLRSDLVERLGWLTERQLLDAVAVGQVTPGPVFTTATFIGYLLGGGAGAAVATVGIFLPAFVFVALSGALVPGIRRSPIAGAALDGVNVASLALIALVTLQLGRSALVDRLTFLVAIASVLILFVFRVNAIWLVLGGALLGLVATLS